MNITLPPMPEPGSMERMAIAALLAHATQTIINEDDKGDIEIEHGESVYTYDYDQAADKFTNTLYRHMFRAFVMGGAGGRVQAYLRPLRAAGDPLALRSACVEAVAAVVQEDGYWDDVLPDDYEWADTDGEDATKLVEAHLTELWEEGRSYYSPTTVVWKFLARRSRSAGHLIAAYQPRHWLIDGIMMAGGSDYGVLSAEAKAGKSWLALDLAVAVGVGIPWLGRYQTVQGSVLYYAAEGGADTATLRIQAIAAAYDVAPDTIALHVIDGAPDFTTPHGLERFKLDIELAEADLVIVDPLYRASKDVNSASLNEVGAVLGAAQEAAQAADAALLIVAHWNQTGTGTGARRVSGAGPWEWARVLMSMHCDQTPERVTEDDMVTITVPLTIEIEGGNIPGERIHLNRVISSNPRDQNTPVVYSMESREAVDTRARMIETLGANPGLTTLDLYNPDSPHKVGPQQQVRRLVKRLVKEGAVIEHEWRGPGRDRKTKCLFLPDNVPDNEG